MSSFKKLMTNETKFKEYSNIHDNLCYLDYLNKIKDFKVAIVPPDIAYRSKGNFYSLLYQMKIPSELYLYTLYLNGYTSPFEYDGYKKELKIAIKPPIPYD